MSSRCPIELVSRESTTPLGAIDARGMAADDAASDRAAQAAVDSGLFSRESAQQLEFAVYWSDLEEMADYIEDSQRMTGVTPSMAELERGYADRLAGKPGSTRIRCRRTMMLTAYVKTG